MKSQLWINTDKPRAVEVAAEIGRRMATVSSVPHQPGRSAARLSYTGCAEDGLAPRCGLAIVLGGTELLSATQARPLKFPCWAQPWQEGFLSSAERMILTR